MYDVYDEKSDCDGEKSDCDGEKSNVGDVGGGEEEARSDLS